MAAMTLRKQAWATDYSRGAASHGGHETSQACMDDDTRGAASSERLILINLFHRVSSTRALGNRDQALWGTATAGDPGRQRFQTSDLHAHPTARSVTQLDLLVFKDGLAVEVHDLLHCLDETVLGGRIRVWCHLPVQAQSKLNELLFDCIQDQLTGESLDNRERDFFIQMSRLDSAKPLLSRPPH